MYTHPTHNVMNRETFENIEELSRRKGCVALLNECDLHTSNVSKGGW
jgi:hypothetical protein